MRKKLPVLLMVVGTVLLVFAAIGSPVLAQVGPPGNNGTIKVDGVEFDSHPDNEPHVGCTFQIDWYGFDANAVSQVTFETQPPTGTRTLLTDIVTLDNDDNSGGGSEAGLDGSRTYTLSFTSADFFQPNQGFHVKLTINTTGSQGADTKFKVFWVTGCGPTPPTSPPPTTTTPPPTTPPPPTTTTPPPTTTTPPPVTTTPPPVTTTPPPPHTTTPPPVTTTPPPATTTPPPPGTTTPPPPVGGPPPGGPPNQPPKNQPPPVTAFTGPEDLYRIGLAALGFLSSGSGLFLMGYRRRESGIELPPPPDQF